MPGLIGRTFATCVLMLVLICAGAGQTGHASAAVAASAETSIIAGNLSLGSGYSGDGGAAINAQLNRPFAVAADNTGNVFIADSLNDLVRKVDTNGKITTVAIHNIQDASGRNIQFAVLQQPAGLTVDGSGNLFISDRQNKVVLKMDPAGRVTVVAGTFGKDGYSGDGGPATSAELFDPAGIAVDKEGNLFIADSANHVVRKVDSSGIIHTVAGNKALGVRYGGDGGPALNAQLYDPEGIAVDSKGNLFIADTYHSAIRKVDAQGTITTVAGLSPAAPGYRDSVCGYSGDGGRAVTASLALPLGIAVNDAGELFIADSENDVIRKVDSTGRIFTLTGDHATPKSGTSFISDSGPDAVAIDKDGNLVIAYTRKSVVEKLKLK